MPKTDDGNCYILVFQDFLTKWPLAYAMPDQKSERIARILVQEVIPLFGVPEALLSDRGTNLLSHLMLDLCSLLGTQCYRFTGAAAPCSGVQGMYKLHAAAFAQCILLPTLQNVGVKLLATF